MMDGRSTLRVGAAGALVAAVFAAPPLPARPVSPCAGHLHRPTPAAAPAGRGAAPGPVVVSPEVLPDKRVVFRLLGPDATDVGVQGVGRGRLPMVKGENGIWEATVGPLTPGAYQYSFVVQGVQVPDPRNQATNETTAGYASLLVVPGSEMTDTKNVPHGALTQVFYDSTVLGRQRRMHVYTPPGYGASGDRYPVFYLLHGSGDSDQSWSALGRAGIILDNLIAAHKAKPMVVVMPAGHTTFPATPASRQQFIDEFLDRHHALRGEELSRAQRSIQPGDCRSLDGRWADPEYRTAASRQVRLHRCLQRRHWPEAAEAGPDLQTRRLTEKLGEAASGGARRRGPEEGPEAALVRHR